MTAQKGKDLLLKVDTNGAGSFVTVAGLRARTLAFNAATVDVTDTELVGRWRELLDGAGVKTARITGSGIFKDASTDEGLCAPRSISRGSTSGLRRWRPGSVDRSPSVPCGSGP